MTATRNGHEYRQSGVPGLIIFGKSSFRSFTLYAEVGDRALPVVLGAINEFPTVRDAKKAAARMADLFPWGSDNLIEVMQADLDANRRKIIAALTEE